ncbi:MAG: ATP synthase F1 subunit epsilon [Phycisphaerae bacterium]|jgi:F-type H+-transporting ATPase subunit epsilon|nr:ATP synthase F1 subunit epsilon [Phycisphaerae bacterium]
MPETHVAGQLKCQLVTPEKLVADQGADFVIITAHDGQRGILPEHAAILFRLAPGIMRIDADNKQTYFFVDGGFAEVLDNQVTVLTSQAIPADKLDPQTIDEELNLAEKMPATTKEDQAKRDAALKIARAKRSVLVAIQSSHKK